MRIRTGLSLALFVLAALPVAASAAPSERPVPVASVALDSTSSIHTPSTAEYVMSIGTSVNGTAVEVREQVAAFAKLTASVQGDSVSAEDVRQANAAKSAIDSLSSSVKPGDNLSAAVVARSSGDGQGSVEIHYTITPAETLKAKAAENDAVAEVSRAKAESKG